MLILARKIGESVEIVTPDGHRTTIKVTDIDGGIIRLGFAAPVEVQIYRTEVGFKTREERLAAAAARGKRV